MTKFNAESARATELFRLLGSASSERELLDEIAEWLCATCGAEACDILLFERDGGLVYAASTSSSSYVQRLRIRPGIGLCGRTAADEQPRFVPSGLNEDPEFREVPGIEERNFDSAFVAPLIDGASPLGVVMLKRSEPWQMSADDRDRALSTFAIAGTGLAAFRAVFASGNRTRHMAATHEVTHNILGSPYLEEILQLLVSLTAQKFDYKVCTVRLLDEARGELVLRATQAPARAYQRKRAIKLGESIAGRAIAENRPVTVADVQVDESYIGHDLAVEQGLRSMVCVPLTVQGRVVGVLSCYTDEVREFPEDEITALETLARQSAISIEHAKLQVRSTLMQEMHHRVKNNLQQVASLLRIQMNQSHYKSLEEALSDSLSRILAIASVHDLLSREDLDHVGILSIAEHLVQNQIQSLMPPDKSIRFQVRGNDVHLNMTQATQVALILNELIQNAMEHGFKSCDDGEIHVSVEEAEGIIGLWVSNHGDLLPDGFDPARGRLGLQIVESLVRSLGGTFSLENRLDWTVAEVRFHQAGSE